MFSVLKIIALKQINKQQTTDYTEHSPSCEVNNQSTSHETLCTLWYLKVYYHIHIILVCTYIFINIISCDKRNSLTVNVLVSSPGSFKFSLNHSYWGSGWPVAMHERVITAPSLKITWGIGCSCMVGGTGSSSTLTLLEYTWYSSLPSMAWLTQQ